MCTHSMNVLELLVPLGTVSWHRLCVAWLFVSPGYFQQPQGKMVTDASLLCPRVRLACGVGVMCSAQHLAVAMETAIGRWRSFEFDYPRMRCARMITTPHRWNSMCPSWRMWLRLRYGDVEW